MRQVSRVMRVSSKSKNTNPGSPESAGPNAHSSWSMRSSVSVASYRPQIRHKILSKHTSGDATNISIHLGFETCHVRAYLMGRGY